MTIGDKIKKIRTFRNMTQAELGAALGWGDKGANRLAQYETNYRVPRKDLVTEMAKILDVNPLALHEPTTMDASELMHICSQSGTGCRVYEERIPIDYQTAVMAEEFNMNLTTCALNGGEDYELLFTVPLTAHEAVSQIKDVKVIGHITKAELGCALVTRDGNELELKAQGWNPLKQ